MVNTLQTLNEEEIIGHLHFTGTMAKYSLATDILMDGVGLAEIWTHKSWTDTLKLFPKPTLTEPQT